ncbi:D-alanyl-D-alanine carboxypeptidase/D-alanyl-D-alanine endopeptidase [Corynebacterium aquilae]|uniref:D-alanyl-D-alanine carboxypeptidase n=1 Tax=Corynebacterium aquilae DSM 44791 TaxID=1431546 RepID=A0A1L7CIA5_9CORY|nr:D-alanyl-D-alanine carboxypeptidase/D-alanyl-D-alanine-endopeptidase [Corynebacterium aquilae]APT85503.1 hypothetical protein CAQU_11070 [Corynebacterium aquilae DSM 44791]
MQKRSHWWITTAVIVAAAVAGTTGVAVWQATTKEHVVVADGQPLQPATVGIVPVTGTTPVDEAALAAHLDELADNKDLGELAGEVIDTTTGATIWQRNANTAVRPASTTKILTSAAALLTQDPEQVLTTTVYRDPNQDGTIIIKAAGDVMMSQEQINQLAEQITASGTPVKTVLIDTSVWQGEDFLDDWDRENIGAGFIAPMQPAMIRGARIGGTTGDLPRSSTPALDVAHALATALGTESFGFGTLPKDAPEDTIIATVDSQPLLDRLRELMLDSDNVMAEAEGRNIAVVTGAEPTIAGGAQATLNTLAGHGFDINGVTLVDNSGLSDNDQIPPRLLTAILQRAATDHQLRPLLDVLPVAGATGTLTNRFTDLNGRGWARGKTGTLTTTSALAGVITSEQGHVYSYAFISNDSSILPARKALDELVSGLRN